MPDKGDILLIEDNPNDAELALRALRRSDLDRHVTLVHDGAEAIELIFGTPESRVPRLARTPRVILLDLKLPKVDGLEVLRRLKEDERTRPIPVVVLTSSAERKDMVGSYRNGVNSYVVKPVDFETFARSVSGVAEYWMKLNQTPR